MSGSLQDEVAAMEGGAASGKAFAAVASADEDTLRRRLREAESASTALRQQNAQLSREVATSRERTQVRCCGACCCVLLLCVVVVHGIVTCLTSQAMEQKYDEMLATLSQLRADNIVLSRALRDRPRSK